MNLKNRINKAAKKFVAAPDFAAMTDAEIEHWADRVCPNWRHADLSFLTDEQLELVIKHNGDLSALPGQIRAKLEYELAK